MIGWIKKPAQQSITPGEYMKIKSLILCSFSLFLISCASLTIENSVTGIFKVTSKDCNGNTFDKAACDEVKLLEIVKGNFYKVEDHEYTFVVWSGEVELNYIARKLSNFNNLVSFPFELVIDESDSFIERLIFSSEENGKYESGKPGAISTIYFTKASQKEIAKYIKEYPGNN